MTNQAKTQHPIRLATIRRLYFYLVALISFVAGLAGLDSLLDNLSDAWLGSAGLSDINRSGYLRDNIASSASILLVAAPIFLLHWGFMQRRQGELGERGAALRKFFLYGASAVAVGYALFNAYGLLEGLARLAFGELLAESSLWPSDWLHLLLTLGFALLLQIYFHRVLVNDGDYGKEEVLAGRWRRIYQMLVGLAGLAIVIWGAGQILETFWRAIVNLIYPTIGPDWWRNPLSDGLALLIVGSVLARINWQRWLQITAQLPDEARAGLRRFYLYAAVVISALVALAPTAALLRELLLLLFGTNSSSTAELLDKLTSPLAYIPVGVIAWLWHWRVVRNEVTAYGESLEGATVRRLYYYSVAATGLALLWFGATDLLQAVLDWWLVQNPGSDRIWTAPLAEGLSLLAVGAPIWAIHWRTAQQIARQTDLQGSRERASGPRKAYLYGVALAGALLILFYLAQVVYRLLLLVLGAPNVDLFSSETVDHIARSGIAALLWGVHLLAIRGDGQMGTETPEPDAQIPLQQREALQRRIAQLEIELTEARAALTKLEIEG
ncbi:MAG: DUF5671 domain-containing protein [Chloroflexi bacterium]|nr:DUF5671 domain-containing protein [Chloroflexota bacterium]